MRVYYVPPDSRGREKVIGGIFTITQFIFISIGVVLGLAISFLIYSLMGNPIIGVIIGLIASSPILVFGFVKIKDMELFPYLVLRVKYKFAQKKYFNINQNYKGENK